ncbi:MAG TPA: mitochondrial fission ELM1 family protein [Micropepsaceae bacterium]|nr:mitochondrial fission ELM1 family protein [Micropepsaceae bacterium]
MSTLSCWVVTDGKAGMESQCVGLAEALGLTPTVKRVRLRSPWRQLTPYFRFGGRVQFTPESDSLEAPWPDLLIATGRHSVAASILVRKLSGGHTRNVQLQNPVIASSHFDLVVVPRHDELHGANIISTRGALHRITPELLRKGADDLRPEIARLARPYVSVLIGGSNAAYRLGPAEMTKLSHELAAVARDRKASLLVTPSRRTDEECLAILKAELAAVPHYLWDGRGENPYFGLLGLADFIVVTGDSVNMVSESASTGKPVYVVDLPGDSAKFERFHRALRADGVTRVFAGKLEPYVYAPLDDVREVAARVEALLRP